MKKTFSVIIMLLYLLTMVGCNRKSMNYIISHEPKITGIVIQCFDDAILIENSDGKYMVSLDVENSDSMTHFSIGDEVVVYYDGNIAESFPMQINTVYGILLLEPADRTVNENP